MSKYQKITPCLWFNNNAKEAVDFYTSVFKNSKIISTNYYSDEGKEFHHHKSGDVLTILFSIEDQQYIALNGGNEFKFNEAVSLQILCDTQKEIDYYWEKLSQGGEEGVCGWLKDKYGFSWQVSPTILNEMLKDKDSEKVSNVFKAFMQMKKFDIETLKQAYDAKLVHH